MLSEIITLIDLLRQLMGRKSELDQEYFEQFIQPTWEAFIKVHQSYKVSLGEYKEAIREISHSIKKIQECFSLLPDGSFIITGINRDALTSNSEDLITNLLYKIEQDSKQSADLRVEVIMLLQHLPSTNPMTKKKCWLEFMDSISSYFASFGNLDRLEKRTTSFSELLSTLPSKNIGMSPMRTNLRDLLNTRRKELDIKGESVIDMFISEAQKGYEKVADSYYELRKDLLN